MFSKLLKRKTLIKAPLTPAVPSGVTVWAVGDVHGRLDLLVPLIGAIQSDSAATTSARKMVIFLGDYIDRGPQSRGVVQHLAGLPGNGEIEWRFLKGNHEATMLEFLEDSTAGSRWCEYGGEATLQSFGLRAPQLKHKPEAWAHLSADLDHKVTDKERAFLENLELSVSVGDYFFTHAGALPGEPLDRQTEKDLMWIRGAFLHSDVDFEQVVVHGHTPRTNVYADHRRIGIDTKAYDSGVLTALRLAGTERTVIQSFRNTVGVIETRTLPLHEASSTSKG